MRARLKKISLLLLVILGLILLYINIDRYIGIKQSDIIIRVSFTGLENMFHDDYEYYAINTKRAYQVPRRFVIKKFGEEVETRDIYDDTDTFYWYAALQYVKTISEPVEDNLFLQTSLGDEYQMYYRSWAGEQPLNVENQKIMVRVAETLFSIKMKERPESRRDRPYDYSVLSFMLIQNGDQYLIKDNTENRLYRLDEEGNLIKIMDRPSGGTFNYYYFYGTK